MTEIKKRAESTVMKRRNRAESTERTEKKEQRRKYRK
jgi:hypothetical protein